MTNLLKIYHRAIWKLCLVCLAQDGVQRLVPSVAAEKERKACYYNVFHSLDWIVGNGGRVKVEWRRACHGSYDLENRVFWHAFDGETRIGQVKFTSNELFTDLRYEVLESCAEFCDDDLVGEGEPTILIRLRIPIVILELHQLHKKLLEYFLMCICGILDLHDGLVIFISKTLIIL